MKILHTSDWHLGRALFGKKRYGEAGKFLDWLAETIEREKVDVLLVAGDVFDTGAPGNQAQELYYEFLCRIARSSCRHAVVVAGNHDSPSFLAAPRKLLERFDIHVVGKIPDDVDDEILVLADESGAPGLIVCAVPYLRERDMRESQAGETAEDKRRNLAAGIRGHYEAVAAAALRKREECGGAVPIVASGHLFVAGGECTDGDGMRELYIGALGQVPADIFADSVDYVALGHLHSPQKVAGAETRRYSGSPLAVGFGDSKRRKSVLLVDLADGKVAVEEREVPVFQELASVRGDWAAIESRVASLREAGSRAWLEVIYDGDEVIGDLRARMDEALSGSELEVLQLRNNRVYNRILQRMEEEETLANLDETAVFERCLDANCIPDGDRADLLRCYGEIVASVREEDSRAE